MDENFELMEAMETISKNIKPNTMSGWIDLILILKGIRDSTHNIARKIKTIPIHRALLTKKTLTAAIIIQSVTMFKTDKINFWRIIIKIKFVYY